MIGRLMAATVKTGLILALGVVCTARAKDSNDVSRTVVVTTNRTEENIQDVPVDVSVVSGQLASVTGITDLQSLASWIPGLLVNRQANSALPFIRGVGSPVGTIGDEPSVAFYVDDVYEPSGSGALANLSSIDRIEVEKGPQGTVFGRNATGGVIQVFTRDPTADPHMDISVGLANYDTQSAALYATGSLTSTLAANVALDASQQRNGWGKDVLTGVAAYTGWDYDSRVKLLWTPCDRTSAMLNLDYEDMRTEEGINLRAWPGTTSFDPAGAGFPAPAGYYDVNGVPHSHSITHQFGASLKVTHDFGWARLVNITARRDTKAVTGVDEDPGIALADVALSGTEHTWTQELRLSSTQTSRSSWIAGLFYYHDVSSYDPLHLYGVAFLPLPYVNTFATQTTESWAAFAQGRREIMSGAYLTVGIRDTRDHRSLQAAAQYASGSVVPSSNSPRYATWNQPTYRAALEYRSSDDLMTYIAYNKGFKSGVFNTTVLPGAQIEHPVSPETLNAYTAGAKSDLLEHRLRVDAEGFYYDYRNIQLQQIVAGATYVTNAARAVVRGVDVQATLKPISPLSVMASMEVLSGHYTSFRNGPFYVYNAQSGGNCLFVAPGSCPSTVYPPNYNASAGAWDLRGDQTIQSPRFSASLMIQDEIPSHLGNFTVTGAWIHSASYYADPDNGLGQVAPSSSNNDKQPVLNLFNASVDWNSLSQRWQARLWGKNLSGERYWSYATELVFVTQYSAAPPRTFGITLAFRL